MALTGKAKKIVSIVGVVLVVLVVALVILVASLGGIIKTGIETVGSAVTKSKITVENVDFSLLRGKLSIDNLVVGNPDGYNTPSAFELSKVNVSLSPASIFTDTIVLREVIIDGPKVTYEAGLGNSNMGTIQKNIAAFLPAGGKDDTKPEPAEKEAGAGKKIIIEHFLFDNAEINLSVKLLQGKAVSVPLPKIEARAIGKKSESDPSQTEGVAAGEAVAIIMNQVVGGVITAATEAIGKLGGVGVDAIKDAGKVGTDAAKAGVDAVKNIGGSFKGLLKKGDAAAPAAE